MTSGNLSRSFGGLRDDVSTGTDLGSLREGVSEPGVDGGVNAGLRSVGGGEDLDSPWLRSKSGTCLPIWGRGEYIGEACEGKSGITPVKEGISL